jgi:sec-independent protein translocase protein TatA
MPNIGPLEIGILLLVVLLIFGPKKLPQLGSSLGQSIRGFGHGIKGEDETKQVLDPAEDPVKSSK